MSTRASRRPTVKDVAGRADVSPMTVSYAFNHPARVAEATRRRVLEAAAELGYRPDATAQALRSGRTRQLGVVVGEHLSYLFDDPQAAQFLAGIADVCVSEDLGLVLIPTRGDAGDVDRVLAAAVDGYVLWTTVAGDPVLTAVADSGRPAAIQGGPVHPGVAYIGPDDRAAASAVATAALRSRPEATPVVVSFPLDRRRTGGVVRGRDLPADLLDLSTIPFPVTGSRLAGYRDAVTDAGYDWADVRVAVAPRNERRLGDEAIDSLIDEAEDGEPLIVLTMSDQLALGAASALARTSREATLTGWDGTAEAAAAGVWSVQASLREQGRACARAVLAGESGAHPVPWTVIGPRGSSATGA